MENSRCSCSVHRLLPKRTSKKRTRKRTTKQANEKSWILPVFLQTNDVEKGGKQPMSCSWIAWVYRRSERACERTDRIAPCIVQRFYGEADSGMVQLGSPRGHAFCACYGC